MNQITNIKQSYHINWFGFELLKILDWKHVYLLFTYSTYDCKCNKNYCTDKHQVWIEWKVKTHNNFLTCPCEQTVSVRHFNRHMRKKSVFDCGSSPCNHFYPPPPPPLSNSVQNASSIAIMLSRHYYGI